MCFSRTVIWDPFRVVVHTQMWHTCNTEGTVTLEPSTVLPVPVKERDKHKPE